jgi:hypothetical protein
MMRHITTDVVRGVTLVYRHFYSKEHTCNGAEGSWPHLFEGDQPVVCKACEWNTKRAAVQERVIGSRLSMPVARKKGIGDKVRRAIIKSVGGLVQNPLDASELWRADLPKQGENARLATNLANYLSWAGHVVFYVHRSQAINLIYSQREIEAEDVLLYAPVLVYWCNRDARNGGAGARLDALIEMRSCGFTFILGE